MHLARACLFLLKKIINSSLNINAELRSGQLLSTKLILFPLGPFLLETIITAETLRPDLAVVQYAYLVLLAPAVQAHHEWFLLQMIIFHFFELVLLDGSKTCIQILYNLP